MFSSNPDFQEKNDMKVKIGQYVKIYTGKLDANAAEENGKYPFFTCAVNPLRINTYKYDCECVLVAGNGDLNVKYYYGKFNAYQRTYIIESKDHNLLSVPYLYRAMEHCIEILRNQSIGGVIKYIKLNNLTECLIPLPAKSEQEKIVEIFRQIDKIIHSYKVELELLDDLVRSRFVEMFGDPVKNELNWPIRAVEDCCRYIYGGGTPSKKNKEYFTGSIPWISSKDMKEFWITDSKDHITQEAIENSSAKLIPAYSVIMVIRSGILKHTLPIAVNKVMITVNQDLKAFIPLDDVSPVFLGILFKMLEKDILKNVRAVTADNLEFNSFRKRLIICPPIDLQNQFADFVQQVDKSKLAVQKSLDELEILKKSLMQQYFG